VAAVPGGFIQFGKVDRSATEKSETRRNTSKRDHFHLLLAKILPQL
jgi:hypothetical protein